MDEEFNLGFKGFLWHSGKGSSQASGGIETNTGKLLETRSGISLHYLSLVLLMNLFKSLFANQCSWNFYTHSRGQSFHVICLKLISWHYQHWLSLSPNSKFPGNYSDWPNLGQVSFPWYDQLPREGHSYIT